MCEGGPRFDIKEYRFAEEQDKREREESRPELVVLIPEVLDSQYGMYVWPCAVVLAQYLWFHRRMLPGKRILEIGAGMSLPGIVAAKCGAEVILSDTEELPQCLKNCERSCRINNLLGVHILGLTWGQISPNLLSLPEVDIILASDVFFEPEDFEDIITTVYFLMKRNPDAQFWTTYQVRSSNWSIEALLYKWKLKNVHVPLRSFNADKEQLASSPLPGRHTIEMMIISLAGASDT
ncbi:histone-arginine methyltransferase METTL23 isoform X1 [Caretta caretta]|uniref:histone-arginine methyltransferase METTL23 isoform X1 n=2 Tax=Caretta caretta TaxID=8467 RepID=UPI002094AC08|nr:histone-arginine methyltransferase METTL23 isoform X1 [Caretta caretta]